MLADGRLRVMPRMAAPGVLSGPPGFSIFAPPAPARQATTGGRIDILNGILKQRYGREVDSPRRHLTSISLSAGEADFFWHSKCQMG